LDWGGDFVFVVEPDEGFSEAAHLFLAFGPGRAPGPLSSPQRTSVRRWVIEGEIDPIQEMMTRKPKLEGDLNKIMRHPKAAEGIVFLLRRLD
jgi:hypothetical protein